MPESAENPVSDPAHVPRRFALLAGEESGDVLGAPLIEALQKRYPDAQFTGVVGPRMQAAGCQPLESIEALSLFGIGEVIRELPRLFKLRSDLYQRLLQWQPDVVIGIDAPSFNLGLEKRLRQAGIPTVHYVSPTVWAWREGRIRGIQASVDLMLTLLPFEEDFYIRHNVPVRFVGHPLADALPLEPDREAARDELDLDPDPDKLYVAVLPGSRRSEVGKLASPFLATMSWLQKRLPEVGFIVPLANDAVREIFASEMQKMHLSHLDIRLLEGQSHAAMTAANVVLLASGTAALEACLLQRPAVAAYRLAPFTHWLLRGVGLLKVTNVTLPNHLADNPIVPEYIQQDVKPESLGPHLYRWLTRPATTAPIVASCRLIHQTLRRNASERAASAIAELLDARP